MGIYDIGTLFIICVLGGFYLANVIHAIQIIYTQWRDDEPLRIFTFGMSMFYPDEDEYTIHMDKITDADSLGSVVAGFVFITLFVSLLIAAAGLTWVVSVPAGIFILIAKWDKARYKLAKAARKKND